MKPRCGNCAHAPSFTCGQCENVLYCSNSCAQENWRKHAHENCTYLHLLDAKAHVGDFYRKVVFTTREMQYVEMHLRGGEEIGEEVHAENTQYFYIDRGAGWARVGGERLPLREGSVLIVPAGTRHNVGTDEGMWLHTVYAPPQHPSGRAQRRKEEE